MTLATTQVPRFINVSPAANTAVSLLTLLTAYDTGTQKRAQYVQIQLDPSAGSAKLYIGNSDLALSPATWGVSLVAGQAWAPPSVDSNLYNLGEIYIYCDTGSISVGVTLVTR